MPFTRISGVQTSYDSNSTNQAFETADGGTLSTDMETVTATDTCSIVLPSAPFSGERHRIMADGGTATVSGGAHLLIGGPYAVQSGGSLDVTFDALGHWIANGQGINPVSTSQFTWYVDGQNVTGLASDSNDGATPTTPLLTVAEFGRRVRTFDPTNNYNVILLSNVLSTDTYQPSGLTAENQAGGGNLFTDQGILITFFGKETIVTSGTTTSAGSSNDTPNVPAFLTSASIADFTPFIGKLIRVTSGANIGASAFVVQAPGANAANVSDWVNAGPPAPGDTFDIVDWSEWNAPLFFSSPSSVEVDLFNLVVPSTVPLQAPVGGMSLSFIECRIETLPILSVETDPHYGLIHSLLMRPVSDPPDLWEINGVVPLVFGSAILNTNVLLHDGAFLSVFMLQIVGGSLFTASRFNPGGRLWVFDFGAGHALGIYDWPVGQRGLELACGALLTLSGTLWGSGPGSAVRVRARGALDVIDGEGLPIITGIVQDIELEDEPPNAAGKHIPQLVGGAGVPAASDLITWTQWAAAPFNGSVMSYRTGAQITTIAAPSV